MHRKNKNLIKISNITKIQHKNSLRVVRGKRKKKRPHQQPHSDPIKVEFITTL